MLKTLIVDDEPLARKGLRIRLYELNNIDIVGEANNGQAAIDFVLENDVDLVFIDIQMPGITGIEAVEQLLNKAENLPHFIFVTAFDEYALKAFEMHAIDYLLKPVDEDRLAEAVEKVTQRIAEQQKRNKPTN